MIYSFNDVSTSFNSICESRAPAAPLPPAKEIAGIMKSGTCEPISGVCPFNWRDVKVVPGTTISCVFENIFLSRDFVKPDKIDTPADEHGLGVDGNGQFKDDLIKTGLAQEALALAVKFEFLRENPGRVACVNLNPVPDREALTNHNAHLERYAVAAARFTLEPGSIESCNDASIHHFMLTGKEASVAWPVIRPSCNGLSDCLHEFKGMLDFFKSAYPLVQDKIVFVNCNQGLSRSTTFSILLATTNAMLRQKDFTAADVFKRLASETDNLMNARFSQGPGALNDDYVGMMIHALDSHDDYFKLASTPGKMMNYAVAKLGYNPTVHGDLEVFMRGCVGSIKEAIVNTITAVVALTRSDEKNHTAATVACKRV